jgi:Ca2+-binding RTX toxin-like protein
MVKVKGSNKADILYGSNDADIFTALDGDDIIFTQGQFGLDMVVAETVDAGKGDDSIVDLTIDWSTIFPLPKKKAFIDGGGGDDTIIVQVVDTDFDMKHDFTSARAAKFIETKSVETIIYWFNSIFGSGSIAGSADNEVFDVRGATGISKVAAAGGNDILITGGDNLKLDAGSGRDVITVDGANCRLTGGLGKDFFLLNQFETPNCTISDFDRGVDKIIFDYDTQWINFSKGLIAEPGMFDKDRGSFEDHVTFTKSTHSLFYDGRLMAHLPGVNAVSADDFLF